MQCMHSDSTLLTHRATSTSVSDVAYAAGRVARVPPSVHVAAACRCILHVQVVDGLAGAVSAALAGDYTHRTTEGRKEEGRSHLLSLA